MTDIERLKAKIQQRLPRVQFKTIEKSWWRFLPKKMRPAAFANILNNTIYYSEEDLWLGLLAHEYKHMMDCKKMGILGFTSMYAWPQIGASFGLLMAVLALAFGLGWLAIIGAVIGLGFLVPWPAKGRAFLEMNACAVEMYCVHLAGEDTDKHAELVIDALQEWLYYKMVWSHGEAHRMTSDALDQIRSPGAADTDNVFKDVHEILTQQTVVPRGGSGGS